MGRLRLAFFSPFNPQRSGVSDYSEELLPYLSNLAEVDLVAGPYVLSNTAITRQFCVISADHFLASRSKYDMAVYQIANSYDHHAYMIPCMRAFPGVAVFHDYYLHHLVIGLTLGKGDAASLRRILRTNYGDQATRIFYRLLLSIQDPYQVSMVRPLIDSAKAIITHNDYARRLVLKDRPEKHVCVIPMGMPAAASGDRASLRAKHGFMPGDFVLTSVSTLSYTKRIEVVLEAFRHLVPRYHSLHLLILGGGHLGDSARRLIQRSGLEPHISVTGWLPADAYNDLLVASDAVVDLRYPSGAETSASLLRAIAAGKPAIVSAQGSFLELPDDFALKVAVGIDESERLAEAISTLADRPALCAKMESSALAYAESQLRLDRAAAAYIGTIGEAMAIPSTPNTDLEYRPGRRSPSQLAWSSTYKVFRLCFLCRKYGLTETLNRIRGDRRIRSAQPTSQRGAVA